jgi:hypothetical protein
VGYKILIALVYLIAVSAILVSLLLDRTSCNPKPAKPNPVREIPARAHDRPDLKLPRRLSTGQRLRG